MEREKEISEGKEMSRGKIGESVRQLAQAIQLCQQIASVTDILIKKVVVCIKAVESWKAEQNSLGSVAKQFLRQL